tara:strand:- start:138 stop:1259 length:1122 start_codon:yes stop_codon:yes gene_type:complete
MVIDSQFLRNHLIKVAKLYSNITPGAYLTPISQRTGDESDLFKEIKSAENTFNTPSSFDYLNRKGPLTIATGDPQGTWAYVYYISFHELPFSEGPRYGYYPVFLLSMDQQQCWLSLCLAAASEGVSGRGGWSNIRGERLRKKAEQLGSRLTNYGSSWVKGPITLGPEGSQIFTTPGADKPAARAYESGSIIAMQFNPNDPPFDLEEQLATVFQFYDQVLSYTSQINAASMIEVSEEEWFEQTNASITGEKAENFFKSWIKDNHPEWGKPIDKTTSVGLGYDIEFDGSDIKVEVKGCRGNIENLRMTKREWYKAKRLGGVYCLAIVSHLDTKPKVDLIFDPYGLLQNDVAEHQRLQITYVIPHTSIISHTDSFA